MLQSAPVAQLPPQPSAHIPQVMIVAKLCISTRNASHTTVCNVTYQLIATQSALRVALQAEVQGATKRCRQPKAFPHLRPEESQPGHCSFAQDGLLHIRASKQMAGKRFADYNNRGRRLAVCISIHEGGAEAVVAALRYISQYDSCLQVADPVVSAAMCNSVNLRGRT